MFFIWPKLRKSRHKWSSKKKFQISQSNRSTSAPATPSLISNPEKIFSICVHPFFQRHPRSIPFIVPIAFSLLPYSLLPYSFLPTHFSLLPTSLLFTFFSIIICNFVFKYCKIKYPISFKLKITPLMSYIYHLQINRSILNK